MIQISTKPVVKSSVTVPGSKSYTHRYFISAALSDGLCRIRRPLDSADTRLTLNALKQMGAGCSAMGEQVEITGVNGRFLPCNADIYMENSGTSMRLLTGVAALGSGWYRFTGTPRMHQRPLGDLVAALKKAGVAAETQNPGGCPPVRVLGDEIPGGKITVNCSKSSQFLSSLLLMATGCKNGLDIELEGPPVSRPYIDMTVEVLEKFGVHVERNGYSRFRIKGGQTFQSGDFTVEPDCSQAGYFWGAAAITKTSIRVNQTQMNSVQGDVKFANVLGQMGCRVDEEPQGIRVTGKELSAVDMDMGDMPDMVPTLAVVAAFAKGETIIRNVAHLKIKESDRLSAVATELGKMGIKTRLLPDGLTVLGATPTGAEIHTYDDHRIAMSFAMAGLKTSGVFISDPGCVAKSFPGFWDTLADLQTPA